VAADGERLQPLPEGWAAVSGDIGQEDPQGLYDAGWAEDGQVTHVWIEEEHEAIVIDLKSEEGQALLAEQRRAMLERVRQILIGGRYG